MQGSTVPGVVEGIVADMTAAAAVTPQPSRRPFAAATPTQIRDALGDEDAAELARQWATSWTEPRTGSTCPRCTRSSMPDAESPG
jgi:hypothetical protein